jgi:hypothetical protein
MQHLLHIGVRERAAWGTLITAFLLPSIEENQMKAMYNNSFPVLVIKMASSFNNFASRVLSVDQEQSSYAPIVGLDKARDMTISDAMKFAWTSCAKLRGAMSTDDIEVLSKQTAHHPATGSLRHQPRATLCPICLT